MGTNPCDVGHAMTRRFLRQFLYLGALQSPHDRLADKKKPVNNVMCPQTM